MSNIDFQKLLEELQKNLKDFKQEATLQILKKCLENKIDPMLLVHTITKVLEELGNKFSAGEIFIPHLLLTANIAKAGFDMLKPELVKNKMQRQVKARVIIGTVEGDIHDLGKDLVALMLSTNGYEVKNLGRSVKTETFLENIISTEQIQFICMSALMTTTMLKQKEIVERAKEKFRDTKLAFMVGGAPVTRAFADRIGAEGYAPDAVLAVKEADRILEVKKGS